MKSKFNIDDSVYVILIDNNKLSFAKDTISEIILKRDCVEYKTISISTQISEENVFANIQNMGKSIMKNHIRDYIKNPDVCITLGHKPDATAIISGTGIVTVANNKYNNIVDNITS